MPDHCGLKSAFDPERTFVDLFGVQGRFWGCQFVPMGCWVLACFNP